MLCLINQPYRWLLGFLRAGLMTSNMEIPAMNSSKDDLTGYSLGLITAKHLGDSGAYNNF
ncbi:hypothetical protein OK016_19700 [Vibrio chagasii]|nr:hypothetical protein [Vibrio chagasii]